MARSGVIGTAIGLGEGGQPVMLILLERGGTAIPISLEGVQVRPLVTGKIYGIPKPDSPPGKDKNSGGGEDSAIDPTARFERPVPIGVSTGHPAITAGTIGCRVKDPQGNLYALSNNHVYANQNAATINDAVIQPGTFDGGESSADDIGKLSEYVPISFGETNAMDAAIAGCPAGNLGNATPSNGYGTPQKIIAAASINLKGQEVWAHNRTDQRTSFGH